MKWINQAKYFSIICTGRHANTPCFMYTKDDKDIDFVKQLDDGNEYLYRLEDIRKINPSETMSRINDLLDDIEEYYPEDTWLTLKIYNKDFKCIYEKSESCECGYGTAKDIVSDFLKTGEYKSEKICYVSGYSYWT